MRTDYGPEFVLAHLEAPMEFWEQGEEEFITRTNLLPSGNLGEPFYHAVVLIHENNLKTMPLSWPSVREILPRPPVGHQRPTSLERR